ncbi:hypothetical protein [Cellulomonas sp. RIT-PI-Y]|uniref:hypothetical protein n=1 Tax=Cellulomonas sp. RIT-PI-Y TaxID=3035297 RepID=UPI0021D9FB21|nr:hypothetical protein [Cellulomonas sp. RIT-PI-Y]
MSQDESTTAGQDASDLSSLTSAASDSFSVRRVFGEAYEQDGALIIPVAVVSGAHGRAGAGGRGRFGDGHGGPRHGDPEPAGDLAEAGSGDVGPGEVGDPSDQSRTGDDQSRTAEDRRADARGPRWPGGPGRPGRHPHPPFGGGRARGTGRAGAGGFATHTRPLGVYVVRDGEVSWQPALDLNRVILGGQIVGALIGTALAVTLPIVSVLRRRR